MQNCRHECITKALVKHITHSFIVKDHLSSWSRLLPIVFADLIRIKALFDNFFFVGIFDFFVLLSTF